jgi:PAS domain S-box-containing protein
MSKHSVCARCGRLFDAASETRRDAALCPACEARSDRIGAQAGSAGSPRLGERPLVDPDEEMMSRTSILQQPFRSVLPPGEMICRLEPWVLRYLDASEDLREFLGRPLDVLLERSVLDDLHPDDQALAAEEFGQVCEFGERNDLVFRLKSRDRSYHYFRIHAQARYDRSGTVKQIRCNLKDVTDRVRAEQELNRRTGKLIVANKQLRQANRKLKETQARLVQSEKLAALGTLASGMAHEINNPLSFCINNVSVIRRDLHDVVRLLEILDLPAALHPPAGGPPFEVVDRLRREIDLVDLKEGLPHLVDSTQRGLERVAKIVAKLREFARLDRAAVNDLNINDSIDQCLMMTSESLTRLGIQAVRRLGEVPLIRGEGAALNQVFLNLITNSIQAIESTGRGGGVIEVHTGFADPEVVVEVIDDGPGIPRDIRPRIFDPFFTTRPPGQGTGLGLATCHGIVAKHGGRIEVESDPGVRTCFRVRLPRQAEHAAEHVADRPS